MDQAILRAAERALSDAYGTRAHLEPIADSAAETEWRCRVDPPRASLPATVLVRAVFPPEAKLFSLAHQSTGEPGARFLSHAAASRFVPGLLVSPSPAPKLLAASPRHGVSVHEDAARGDSFAEILATDDPGAAESALGRVVEAEARLAALSAGHDAEFEDTFRALGGKHSAATLWSEHVRRRIAGFGAAFQDLEIEWTPALVDDVQTVAAAILSPGPWLAFSAGSPSQATIRIDAGGEVLFTDLENAGFRHALLDATAARMAFAMTEHSGRVPQALARTLESQYAIILSTHIPVATDKRAFSRAMLDATAFWLLEVVAENLARVVRFDRTWGDTSLRQRVLFALDTFAREGAAVNYLWDLGYFCRTLHDKLSARWSGVAPMPFFPAFRSAG